ncbi:hypothetical protein EVAR_19300_1 [Eumeta japonica]|uniref:Uncharacterized protein n=1 Tax=Eumeta variegata TaxID=151549 RepID=A0A4C1UER6_EUMVA|nr:hypothetical protein EVAR_19300_1 [Eumeta japonica]
MVNEPDRDLADLSVAEVAEQAESDSPSKPTTVLSEHVSSSSDDEERAFLLFFPLEGDCDLLEFWLETEEAVLLEARLETGVAMRKNLLSSPSGHSYPFSARDLANTSFIKARVRGPFEIPPAPGRQGVALFIFRRTHLTVRLTAAHVFNDRLLFAGANNRRRGPAGSVPGARRAGGWAGDTWYRLGAPSKAGGPRSVRVCRSLKKKGQHLGLAANRVVDTVNICGAWRPAAQRTLERQGREGRGAQRGGDLHKKRIVKLERWERSRGGVRSGRAIELN